MFQETYYDIYMFVIIYSRSDIYLLPIQLIVIDAKLRSYYSRMEGECARG